MLTPVAVFDVNETLLDLRSLDDHFVRLFGDASLRRQWFALVLRNAMSMTITGDYESFVVVAGASLAMIGEHAGVEVGAGDRAAIGEAMTQLPAHPDVAPALETLQAAGLTMAALTNSPQATAVAQLEFAGLDDFFDEIMSVESVGKFKPAPEVYRYAANELGVDVASMTMVAAHDWDIAGAMRAGCRGAYVMRLGTAANPLFPEPDLTGPDMISIADRLLGG